MKIVLVGGPVDGRVMSIEEGGQCPPDLQVMGGGDTTDIAALLRDGGPPEGETVRFEYKTYVFTKRQNSHGEWIYRFTG